MNPELAAACLLATATWPAPPPPGEGEAIELPCGVVDIDVAGRLQTVSPAAGLSTVFALSRARFETGVQLDEWVIGRVAVDAVRSAPNTGYLGIDGETIVARLQIAEARAHLDAIGLDLVAGLVDDAWVAHGNRAFRIRPVAPVLGEEQGWFDRSDLGGGLLWTAPAGWVTAHLTLTNGEGLRFRERNDGKNLAGLVIVRPLAFLGEDQRGWLELTGYARDGSVGLQLAPDHRFAGRLSGRVAWDEAAHGVGYGVEVITATGVAGDGARTPFGLSTWLTADPWGPITAYVRYDAVTEIPGDPESVASTLRTGLGARLPWTEVSQGAHLIVSWEHRDVGPQAAPIAGATVTGTSDTLFVQLGVRFRRAFEIDIEDDDE